MLIIGAMLIIPEQIRQLKSVKAPSPDREKYSRSLARSLCGAGNEASRMAKGSVELQREVSLSDIMMPGLDGRVLFRRLRRDLELELVPVILVTAIASADRRLEGLREGVDDYLVKPFDPRELRARSQKLLSSRRRLLDRIAAPSRGLLVTEIAYLVGFKSLSHFSNAFADQYGERPSAYAARHGV